MNAETTRSRIGSVEVIQNLPEGYNGMVIVCDAKHPQACYDALTEKMDPASILAPPSFRITCTPKG